MLTSFVALTVAKLNKQTPYENVYLKPWCTMVVPGFTIIHEGNHVYYTITHDAARVLLYYIIRRHMYFTLHYIILCFTLTFDIHLAHALLFKIKCFLLLSYWRYVRHQTCLG